MEAVMEDALVMLCDRKIGALKDMQVAKAGRRWLSLRMWKEKRWQR